MTTTPIGYGYVKMSTFKLVFLGVALAIAAIAWYLSPENRLKRKLRAARVWPIGELPAHELGRVVGEVKALESVLRGPLTGRACVYYLVKVEERRSKHWETLFTEHQCVRFLLVDTSGEAIVDPEAADVALNFDGYSRSGTFNDATPAEEALLAKHGLESKGRVFNKSIRYTEAIIAPGELVSILGAGIREFDPRGAPADGYRGAAPTRLMMANSPDHQLMISDDPSTTAAAQRR